MNTKSKNESIIHEKKNIIHKLIRGLREYYKYWRCLSSPSSGPKLPEMLELPKSLQPNPHQNQIYYKTLDYNSLIESNLKTKPDTKLHETEFEDLTI